MYFDQLIKNSEKYKTSIAIKDETAEYTYKELWNEVEKKSLQISTWDIFNKKIIFKMKNSCQWIIYFLAITALGAKIIPVSPDSKDDYIKNLKEKLDADFIVTDENCDSIFANTEVKDKVANFMSCNDKNEMVYHITSGSTGEEKYCIRTVGEFTEEAKMFKNTLKMGKQDTVVCPLPLYHSYAFGFVVMAALYSGCKIVIMEKFIPRKFLNILIKENATIAIIVPIMADLLTKTHLDCEIDLSSMKCILTGAGTISQEIFGEFKNKYKLTLSTNYGSSETGGIINRLGEEGYPGIGLPMDGVQVQIRDYDNNILNNNQEGRMWIKSKTLLSRYYDKTDIFDKSGFYRTGDIAYKDENGVIFITGREKNIVNIGGKKVNPDYVEKVIKSFETVEDSVVTSYRRKQGEEVLVAVVTGNKDFELTDLRKYLNGKLEQYKIPSVIKVVSKIPKNNMGKVMRDELLKLILI